MIKSTRKTIRHLALYAAFAAAIASVTTRVDAVIYYGEDGPPVLQNWSYDFYDQMVAASAELERVTVTAKGDWTKVCIGDGCRDLFRPTVSSAYLTFKELGADDVVALAAAKKAVFDACSSGLGIPQSTKELTKDSPIEVIGPAAADIVRRTTVNPAVWDTLNTKLIEVKLTDGAVVAIQFYAKGSASPVIGTIKGGSGVAGSNCSANS